MNWYTRPDLSIGDSLTDIGALALIGGYDCAAHVRACQRADGSFFRHPTTPDSGLSRDHIISICNFTLWSGDREPLQKFLRYTLTHGFKVSAGSITHRYLTPVVLAAIMHVLGHRVFGYILDILNWPVLMFSAYILPAGYQRILLVEHAIIRMHSGAWAWPWKVLARYVLSKEPSNVFYKVAAGKSDEIEAQSYKNTITKRTGWWHWNNPSDPARGATGVDLDYAIALARRTYETGIFGVVSH